MPSPKIIPSAPHMSISRMSPPVDTGIISLGLGASPQRFFNILEILRRHGIEFFGGRELSFNAAEKRNKLAPFHRLFQTQTWVLRQQLQPLTKLGAVLALAGRVPLRPSASRRVFCCSALPRSRQENAHPPPCLE